METAATRKKRKIKRIVGLSICVVLVVLFALIAYFAVSIYNEIRGKNITEETGIVEIVCLRSHDGSGCMVSFDSGDGSVGAYGANGLPAGGRRLPSWNLFPFTFGPDGAPPPYGL